MSTHEELQLITSMALLVVAIFTYTHKNILPAPGKVGGYFLDS